MVYDTEGSLKYTVSIKAKKQGSCYVCTERKTEKFFGHELTLEAGFPSDGATGARDLKTDAWFWHDKLCATGKWDDGTRVPNLVCSAVLGLVLYRDGFYKEAFYWFVGTFMFGGGECRKNGMFSVKAA